MAEPRFEKGTGYGIIEWYEPKEGGSPHKHYFAKKPFFAQFHPFETEKMVRMYFHGKMPEWMKKYCKIHHLECQQVTHGETGWWLARWQWDAFKPISAPTVEGIIKQIAKNIPSQCKDLVQRVDKNKDVIRLNLQNHPRAFEAFGMFFRKDDVAPENACCVLTVNPPVYENWMTDDDFLEEVENSQLSKLIWELTELLPEPVFSDEELLASIELAETVEEELEFNEEDFITLADYDFQEELIEVVEDEDINVIDKFEELEIDDQFEELFNEELVVDPIKPLEMIEETKEGVINTTLTVEVIDEAPFVEVDLLDPIVDSKPPVVQKAKTKKVKNKIVETTNKKAGVFAGQMSLF